jgi:homoserine O-acetyltransferase/O-succinyltransferase
VVLGGISATRHVVSTDSDTSPGWWENVAGPGLPLDTTRFRILSMDYVDSPWRPGSRATRTVSTHDQAYALRRVLDVLEIDVVHAIVGASYGGMVALAFAESYPARVRRLVVIGAAHESHPMTTALRALQRHIVELGAESGRSAAGLTLARALAVTTYRTSREFEQRFSRESADGNLQVEDYLIHCGRRFAASFTPGRFLSLSLSADLHRVDPAGIRTPTTLIAFVEDRVVPIEQARSLARSLGGECTLHEIESIKGHDAFLADHLSISSILSSAIEVTAHA